MLARRTKPLQTDEGRGVAEIESLVIVRLSKYPGFGGCDSRVLAQHDAELKITGRKTKEKMIAALRADDSNGEPF